MRKGLSASEAGKLGAIESAKTAVIKKQNRIEDWNNNPKLCKFCGTPISYDKKLNDYCNRSCGANFNNSVNGHILANDKICICKFCSIPFKRNGTYDHKYCSKKCMTNFWWSETKTNLISTGIDTSAANNIGKKYLIELHNGHCQICQLSEWQNKPMPLVLDHINGNPYDNLLTNLRIICHNCNAQTPTFAGRNKGNGRIERAKRYIVEKQILTQAKS